MCVCTIDGTSCEKLLQTISPETLGQKINRNQIMITEKVLNYTVCWQLGVVFVLPCHASTTIQMPCTVKAQGTAVRSRQEHIKLSQALHHLFGWRTQIQSLRTLRPDWHFSSTLQLPVAKHFAFSEAGATVGFWAGATEGFGQSFDGHIAIRCALSERCCVTIVKSEAKLEDSSHFTSFLPCCWKKH